MMKKHPLRGVSYLPSDCVVVYAKFTGYSTVHHSQGMRGYTFKLCFRTPRPKEAAVVVRLYTLILFRLRHNKGMFVTFLYLP